LKAADGAEKRKGNGVLVNVLEFINLLSAGVLAGEECPRTVWC
jgi:hypothetical protein